MSLELEDAIILITSRDSTYKNFGTGFVIYREQQVTYVLTCAHVVRDVGGQENVIADGIPAQVIALGENDGFDLAVLEVEGLSEKQQLSLRASGEKGQRFIVAGHYLQGSNILSRKISGQFGDQVRLVSKKRNAQTNAWDLEIKGKYRLQPGYSGSPVVDEASGNVLGVAIQRLGDGETGLAISIEALTKIWQEMPSQLILSSVEGVDNTQSQSRDKTDNLRSERGIDYTNLRNLLKQGKWKEADQETLALILKAANREKEACLDIESIKNFPCTDLCTIDQLWVKYSNGHFGFSVQKRIWENVGGKPGEYNEEALKEFGNRIGWRKKLLGFLNYETWLNYSEITFRLDAPSGHLPLAGGMNGLWDGVEQDISFFSRIETCNL
jgi:hypothetical protein